MWKVANQRIPLCLGCYKAYSQLVQEQIENCERSINFNTAYIASVAGLPASALPMYSERATPIVVEGFHLNNINVSGSVVGTINTGSIGSMDQTISALLQLGETPVADAVRKITETVIRTKDITEPDKQELLEIINAISSEAATPAASRKKIVGKTLLERGKQLLSVAKDAGSVAKNIWPILESIFQ
jgi:hypothetical protein